MAKRNPGVPVLAMNPAPAPRQKKGKTMVRKKRARKVVTRRRRHNPGNPANPRRRRRRRHNPGGSFGETAKKIGLAVAGALAVVVGRWGLQQTSLEPKTRSLVLAGGSVALGAGLAYAVNEEVGASMAATGAVIGGSDYFMAPGGAAPSPTKIRQLRRPKKAALQGLDDDDSIESLGLISAAMSGMDDDEELRALGMGAVTADLEGMDGLDDEDDGMGALTAELGDMYEPTEQELFG